MEKVKEPPFSLLLILACLGSFLAILFTPALPEITMFFNTSTSTAKASVYYYLLGYSFGCLYYAPYSDRYGRRVSLCLGLLILTAGNVLCIVSSMTELLGLFNIGRFIQAFGAAAGLQGAYTITSEVYPHPKNMKMTSFISVAFAIGPSIGVMIGGLLTQYLGWMSCFYFAFIFTLATLVLTYYYIPETLKKKHIDALKPSHLFTIFSSRFRNKRLLYCGLVLGFAIPFRYVFAAEAPFIMISDWKYDPSVFGYFNLIPPIFLASGVVLSGVLTKKWKPTFLIFIGFSFMMLASMLIFVIFSLNVAGAVSLFLLFSISLFGQAFATTPAIAFCMHHAKNKSYTASIMNFINLLFCTVWTFISSLGDRQNILYMPLLFLIMCVFLFFIILGMKRHYTHS